MSNVPTEVRSTPMGVVESESNPYASPSTDHGVVQGPPAVDNSCDFGKILRRWEPLRLIYNLVLTTLVLLSVIFFSPNHLSNLTFWLAVMLFAAISNLCFFIGPALEGYGTYFQLWHTSFTVVLFLAGLGLAAFLALAFVVAFR